MTRGMAAFNRTLAIGDIHGCHTALSSLMQRLDPTHKDQIVFLGDYIDRGPASRKVVETLLELNERFSPIFLRGNHEVMILQAREDTIKSNMWQSYGGLETLFSYGANYRPDWAVKIPESHWTFFESTKRFLETDSHIYVHACLDPEMEMEDQPDWLLYWEFFESMQPHKSGKRVICGHTLQSSNIIKDVGFAACIDTGPASGGWLTCLDANSGNYWQANESGETRHGTLHGCQP